MEGKRDHRLNRGQIHLDAAVVVSQRRRIQLAIVLPSAVGLQKGLRLPVGAPDGAQAGGLGGHDIHAVAVIGRHGGYARSHEFHDLVLDIAVFEDRADDGKGDVLRADKGLRFSGEIHRDHARIGHVIGVAQQLLHQLAAAFADGHGAQCPIARMRVRTEDHPAAAGVHLAHVLMNHRHMRRNIDPTVFLCGGEAEHVVVLVDGAAHGAEGVVAVGQHIGKREFLHPGSLRRLDNPDKRDVVGSHRVKAQPQMFHVLACVVILQNRPGDGPFPGFRPVRNMTAEGPDFLRLLFRDKLRSVDQVDTAVI